MTEVKVTDLRRNLLSCLGRVRRGERLQITSRGKVIAEIVAPLASASESQAAWQRLRGSVLRYDRPLEPVFDPADWEMNR